MRPTQTNYYKGFDPRSIGGCYIWLDAQDARTVGLSGSTVTNVRDKSSNAFLFSNSRGFTYNQTKFNTSYPSFYSSGNPNTTVLGSNTSASLTQPYSVFVVGRFERTSGFGTIIDSTSTATRLSIRMVFQTGPFYYSEFSDAAGLTSRRGNLSYSTFLTVFNTLSTAPEIYSYGTANTLTSSGTFPTATTTGCRIGQSSQLTDTWRGHLCEIIVYSYIPSSTQRQMVEGYLAWKWGIQSSFGIGSTHPYRRIPFASRPIIPIEVSSAYEYWFDAADRASITDTDGVVSVWSNKGSTSGSNATTASGTLSIGTSTQNNVDLIQLGTSGVGQFTAAFPTQVRTRFFAVRPTTDTTATNIVLLNQTGVSSGRDTIQIGTQVGEVAQGVGTRIATATIANQSNAFSVFMIRNASTTASNRVTSNGNALSLTTTAAASGYLTTGVATQFGPNFDVGEIISYNSELSDANVQRLEGYLAWKWGVQSLLPSTHWFKLFPPSLGIFSPPLIGSIQLWADAADAKTLTLSGSNITQWRDNTFSNRTNTSTGTITYRKITDLNSVGVASFDGASGFSRWTFALSQPFTVFVVSRQGALASDGTSIVFGGSNAAAASLFYNNTGQLTMASGGVNAFPGVSYSSNRTAIYCSIFSGASSSFSLNGGTRVTGLNAGTSAFTNPYLGRRSITGVFSEADVGELIMYHRVISLVEQQQIEGYLAWKWGLRNSLPNNHPYKNFKP